MNKLETLQWDIRALSAMALMALILCVGCGKNPENIVRSPATDDSVRTFVAGHTTGVLTDEDRSRSLTVEIWYPSAAKHAEAASVVQFETLEERRAVLDTLLRQAPNDCPTQETHAVRDGELADDLPSAPLIIFSHCQNCGRYWAFSLAEALARRGFVVVSSDHAGVLPYSPDADGEPLTNEQLDVRVGDVRFLMDAIIANRPFSGFEPLKELTIDTTRVGLLGHSFGAVTVGMVAQTDERVGAVVGLAAPMENPLLPGADITKIRAPKLFMLAEEDNSILEVGNTFLRDNFDRAPPPVWRVDIADAGHWSVSDICGLTEKFIAGCGDGVRHSNDRMGESFEYRPRAEVVSITNHFVTAFFRDHLSPRTDGTSNLSRPIDFDGVAVYSR